MKKQPKSHKKSSAGESPYKFDYIAIIPFVAAILLLLIGSFQNSYYCWGFSIWNVIDTDVAMLALIGGLVAIILLAAAPIKNILERTIEKTSIIIGRIPRLISVALLSVILFSLFYFLRSEALVYGDGYSMLGILSAPVSSGISGQSYVQVLSIIINRVMIEILTSTAGLSAQKALGIINIAGGVAGFWALVCIAGKLADNPSGRMFIFVAAIGSGATLLFFGHIENYTWPVALSLYCLYYVIKYVRGESKAPPMVAFALLAFLFHAITAPMLVMVLLAMHFVKKKNANKVFGVSNRASMTIVVTALFVSILIWHLAVRSNIPDLPSIFVQLWPVDGNPYWFLSPEHIVDVLNLLFFLAPLGVLLLAHRIISRDKTESPDAVGTILAWLTLLTFLELFWIDPELGAPRDWDLMAMAGFPLSLWAAYRFSSTPAFRSGRTVFAMGALIIATIHLGPHIYEKSNSEIAVARLDALLWECPHYQTTYNDAYRGISWGSALISSLSRDDLAEKFFVRRVRVDNTSSASWFNLGQIYNARGAIDSSAVCLAKAVEIDPENSLYLLKLGNVRHKQQRDEEALALVSKSETLDPGNVTVHTTKAIILYALGRVEEAISSFHRAHDLEPNSFDQNFNIGVVYYALSGYDKAYSFLKRANELNPSASQVYEKLIPVQLKLGREAEAAATLRQYRRINQKAQSLDYYRTILGR